jgi:hypothetical protein
MSKLYVVDAETIETLREVSNLLSNVLTVIEGDEPVEEWKIAPLEADGAYRPGWLVDLNKRAHEHVPTGYLHGESNFNRARMTLVHSVLWYPILSREDLTQEQRDAYAFAQVEGWGAWQQVAVSRWPILLWGRPTEDLSAPGGELRHAVLAAPPGFPGVLPTEDELRACIESHYRASGYLPAE